jgi:tRNA(Leu) C34 or U34 (ribose-2'-O)-methylase TrmL
MKFSEKKFRQFTAEKQNLIIVRFIRKLELIWQDIEQRQQLLVELEKCLIWSKAEHNRQCSRKLSGIDQLYDFLNLMIPWEQENFRDLRDQDFLIRSEDGQQECKEKISLTVILHDLRSAFNTGSIIRTAECLGVEKLIFSGYTPVPDNKRVQDTSMGTYKYVSWEVTNDILLTISAFKDKGYTVYGLETTTHAEDIYSSAVQSPALLILGNEALGIPSEILNSCDKVLELPTGGWKNSLNVGAAFAAAGYEIYRQWNYDHC